MQQRTHRRDGDSLSQKQDGVIGTAGVSTISHNIKSSSGVQRLFAMPMNRLQIAPPSTTTTSNRPRNATQSDYNPPPERSTKAKTLQEQFETLKRKIKEVQNKNERILEKIHTTQEQERKRSLQRRPPPVFEVEVNLQHPVSESYTRNCSNVAVNGMPHGKLRIASKQLLRTSVGDMPARSHSRSNNLFEEDRSKRERQVTELKALVKELQAKNTELTSYLDKQRLQRQSCNSQLLLVEDKLKKEHLRLETVKSSFRNYSDYTKQIVQGSLDRFMDLLLNKLLQMDKKNKRNVERMDALARQAKRQLELKASNRYYQLPEVSSVVGKDQPLQLEKNKSKEFENIVAKYQQMIRSKNEEYEGMQNRIRIKQREHLEAKQLLEKLKEEKRRLSVNSDQKLAELESSLTVMQNQNRALREELRNSHRTSAAEESASRISVRSFGSEFRQQTELREQQIAELQIKLNSYEKSIIDKNNLVIALERDLLNSKGKYTELFNEYQDSLQKIKTTAKQRAEELTLVQTELKGQLLRKDQQLLELQQRQRQLEQRLVEAEVESNSLRQKLELKQKVPHKEALFGSQDDDLLEFHSLGHQNSEPKTPSSHNGRSNSINLVNDCNSEANRQVIAKLEQLTRQNRNLQVEMIHEKAEAQMARTYKMELERLDIHNKQLELRVQQLNQQVDDLNRHLGEPSELSISIGSTIKSIRRDSSRDLAGTNNVLQLQLLEMQADNMRLNSELINTKKDLELSERMKDQFNNRVKELKIYTEQLEKTNSQLQLVVSGKLKEVETIRGGFEIRLRALTDEKLRLQTELHSQLELKQEYSKKKLDEQVRKSNGQAKLKDIEIERLTVRLKDLQDDLRQKDSLQRKLGEQYRTNLSLLKHELEELKVQNLRQEEVCKMQQLKIRELELEVESGRSELSNLSGKHQHTPTTSHLRTDTQKIKGLENSLLEAKLEKATIEAHLRTSQENNSRLMQETSQMISELEAKKNELAKLAGIYEERLNQQQQIIKSYEKERRSSRQELDLEGRRKSDLKSHQSNLHSEHEYQLMPEEPNIEELFETNEYTKLRPRRKDLSKLLERTGDYIKKLKELIKEKNKKIRVLEKRIEELRSSPHKFHKSSSFNVHTQGEEVVEDEEDNDSVRDNYSVKVNLRAMQMEDRKGGNTRKLRQLENETHLIIEENHLLRLQVDNLQDELARAEEQQNGLVRMKQIYKDEITNLRTACQAKELEIKRLHKQLQSKPQQF